MIKLICPTNLETIIGYIKIFLANFTQFTKKIVYDIVIRDLHGKSPHR